MIMELALALLAAPSVAASLAVFDPLVGHCWVTRIDETTTDRHCFQAMYGGAHVRDEHAVTSGGKQVYAGTTLYSAEGDAVSLIYLNSLGGVGRGNMTAAGRDLRFRLDMRGSPHAPSQHFEPTWRLGDGNYVVTSATGTQRFVLDDR